MRKTAQQPKEQRYFSELTDELLSELSESVSDRYEIAPHYGKEPIPYLLTLERLSNKHFGVRFDIPTLPDSHEMRTLLHPINISAFYDVESIRASVKKRDARFQKLAKELLTYSGSHPSDLALIKKINSVSRQVTLLELVTKGGCSERVLCYFLLRGFSPYVRDQDGKTSLHWLAIQQKAALARMLCDFMPNVNIPDKNSLTPFYYALRHTRLGGREYNFTPAYEFDMDDMDTEEQDFFENHHDEYMRAIGNLVEIKLSLAHTAVALRDSNAVLVVSSEQTRKIECAIEELPDDSDCVTQDEGTAWPRVVDMVRALKAKDSLMVGSSHAPSNNEFDYAVVGAGAAGITVAEMLQRHHYSVALLEQQPYMASYASGDQHGWMHTGSLYAAAESGDFMQAGLDNLDVLLNHYAHFPGMNYRVSHNGDLMVVDVEGSWFSRDTLRYYVQQPFDPELGHIQSEEVESWREAVDRFVDRHQQVITHNWTQGVPSLTSQRRNSDQRAEKTLFSDHPTGLKIATECHIPVKSYDRRMNSRQILSDLLRAFVLSGGTYILNFKFDGRLEGGKVILEDQRGFRINCQNLLLCAGKNIPQLVPPKLNFKNVVSPLLVTHPPLVDYNFVRMSPDRKLGVNHLRHQIDGKWYSIVGNGDFADPNDPEERRRAGLNIIRQAKQVFENFDDSTQYTVYFGTKTEFMQDGKRNYHYQIFQYNKQAMVCIPGKFTFAFTVAVEIFKVLTGRLPDIHQEAHAPEATISPAIALQQHAVVVRDSQWLKGEERASEAFAAQPHFQ